MLVVWDECPISEPGRDGGPQLPWGLAPSKEPAAWEGGKGPTLLPTAKEQGMSPSKGVSCTKMGLSSLPGTLCSAHTAL